MKKNHKLPKPIFTPSTKAIPGEKILTFDESLVAIFGEKIKKMISELSIKIFTQASEHAKKKELLLQIQNLNLL